MSNNIDPSQIVHYISFEKHLCVNRNNGVNQQIVKFDYNLTDTFNFSVVNKVNTILSLSGYDYELFVSFVDSKQQLHVLAYNNTPTFSADNKKMTFVVDTYTTEFLNNIKTQKQCDLTIVAKNKTTDKTSMLLRDVCICYPRPYIPNQAPIEIVNHNILITLNNTVSGSFFAGSNIPQTLGVDSFAFGEGLRTSSANQFIVGSYNTVDGEKAFVIGNGTSDSDRSNAFTVDFEGNVTAKSITVDGSELATVADIPTGLSQLTNDANYATEQWVQDQGYLTEHQDLTAYATKEWVEGKNYLTGVNLEPYATKEQLTLSTALLSNQIATLNIPTKTSDLTNDSGFITGYTAGSGISISNQNVISIDGELGKTYYADDTTLQLNEANNTFSVKSIRSKLNNGPGISLTEDGNGVVTITNTGGGGSGGYVYTAGTGLGLSAIESEAEDISDVTTYYQFYVDEAWFDQHIDAYTSGLQNYEAGTGIAISNENVISVTGMVTSDQIADMATKTWVGQQGFLTEHQSLSAYATSAQIDEVYAKKTDIPETSAFVTSTFVENAISGKADLSSVYTKEETYSYIETDAKINEATSGKADQSTLESVSGQLTNAIGAKANSTDLENYVPTSSMSAYYTSTQVDSAIETAISTVPSTVYTGTDGIKVENGVISLTATIPSTVAELSDASSYVTDTELTEATSAFITVEDLPTEKTKLSQFNNDVGFITSAAIPDTSSFATKTELSNTSTAIVAQIPDTSNYVTSTQVEAQITGKNYVTSTVVEGYATEQYVTNATSAFITSAQIPSEYVTESELSTELEGYAKTTDIPSVQGLATEQYVDSAVNTASGNLQTAINGKTTSGEVKTQIEAYGYQTATDVANAISGKANSADVYTKSEVNTITGTLSTDITAQIPSVEGLVSASQVSSIVEGYNYITGVTLNYNDSSYSVTELDIGGGLRFDTGELSLDGSIPTKVSDLQNDSNFVTSSIVDGYATTASVETAIGNLSSTYYNKTEVNEISSAISSVVSTNYALKSEIPQGVSWTGTNGVAVDNQNSIISLTGTVLSGDGTTIAINNNTISLVNASNYIMSGDNVSKLTNDEGFITGITINYNDSNYNVTEFDVGEGLKFDTGELSLDVTIPTTVAELSDASDYALTSTLSAVSGQLSAAIEAIDIPTVSSYSAGTGISITPSGENNFEVAFDNNTLGFINGFNINVGESSLENATEITFDSDFVLDSEYIKIDAQNFITNNSLVTSTDLADYETVENVATLCGALSAAITGVANDLSSNYVTTSDANTNYAAKSVEGDVTALKAVSGDFANASGSFALANNVYTKSEADSTFMSINTPIPSVEGLISASQASGIASAVTTGYLEDYYTKTEADNKFLTDHQSLDNYYTKEQVVPSTSAAMYEATSASIEAQITGMNYITSGDIPVYTAGTGLKLEGTEFSLSAAGAGENKVLSSANGNIVWADNVAGGSTVDVDTICGMLSSANENLTITKNDNKILFTAIGGGSAGNIIGANGIRVMQDGGNTVISIATAAIIAAPSSFTFDFRNGNGSADFDYVSYNGNQNLIMSYDGTLPGGVTATQITSGYQFDYVSAANVGNNVSTITAWFDAYDITQPTSAEVQIKTIGYVSATITATDASYTWNFENQDSYTNDFTFTYGGSSVVNATITNLPEGISWEMNGNTITFSGTSDTVTKNGTKTAVLTLVADDTDYTTFNVTFTVSGIEEVKLTTPLTFKNVSNNDVAVKFDKVMGSGTNGYSYDYNLDDGTGWHSYTKGDYITLTSQGTVAFSGQTFDNGNGQELDKFITSGAGQVSVYGNIASLDNYSTSARNNTGDYGTPTIYGQYALLFGDCAQLVDAYKLLINFDDLATRMFASTFNGCNHLTNAPQDLSKPFNLISGTYATTRMFQNCSALTSNIVLNSDTLYNGAYNYMFQNCSNITSVEINCTSMLSTAGGNTNHCGRMFEGCSKLSSISVNFTDWNVGQYSFIDWVNNVAATGTFYKPAALSAEYGTSRIPTNWTVVNKVQVTGTPTVSFNYDESGTPVTQSITSYISYDGGGDATYTALDELPSSVTLSSDGTFSCVPSAIVERTSTVRVQVSTPNNGSIVTNVVIELVRIDETTPLTIKVGSNGNITIQENNSTKNLSYSINGGQWQSYSNNTAIPVTAGNKVAFSGNNSGWNDNLSQGNNQNFNKFTSIPSGSEIYGNIMSLVNFNNSIQTQTYQFMNIFKGTYIVDASKLILPNNTNARSYQGMFANCTSLTGAPVLHAIPSGSNCYVDMFTNTKITYLKVTWTSGWNDYTATYWWMDNTPTGGVFECPRSLTIPQRTGNGVPASWSINYID